MIEKSSFPKISHPGRHSEIKNAISVLRDAGIKPKKYKLLKCLKYQASKYPIPSLISLVEENSFEAWGVTIRRVGMMTLNW